MPAGNDLLGPSPIRDAYASEIKCGNLQTDNAQLQLVTALDALNRSIEKRYLSSKSSALGWLFKKRHEERPQANGIYIWGGVGAGKTFLMDLFFNHCKLEPKKRVHFHDFMTEIHEKIFAERKRKKPSFTDTDPVKPVAHAIAKQARLLCFDEFVVNDIADAMLMSRLFRILFDQGVIVVATSNIIPDLLYHNGLNRQLFTPFIDLLKEKMVIHEVRSNQDYRLKGNSHSYAYQTPLGRESELKMNEIWRSICGSKTPEARHFTYKGRRIQVNHAIEGAARINFDELCREPLGAGDFSKIADLFPTLLIDNIPVMEAAERNVVKRFILLIDILYDHGVNLIVSAAKEPACLYNGQNGIEYFEFERTVSRMIEMRDQALTAVG